MSSYAQLGEVRTYYEEDGNGEALVLLHPGGADSRAWEIILPGFVEHFHVYRPDRRGHGRTPDVTGPLTYNQMALDTIAFLEEVVGGPAHLVGHSDGTPVALTVALMRPDLVRRLVLGAGVFNYEGWTPGSIDLDDETVAFFVEYHGAVSPDGPEHFHILREKLHRMQSEQPTFTVPDLAVYPGPSLVMIGDDDHEIHMAHTLAMREGLRKSQLAVVPGTGHGLFGDKPELCSRLVIDFLTEDLQGDDR